MNRDSVRGMVLLGLGLLAGSVNSFLERFVAASSAVNWVRGFLDGLAVVVFAAATFLLARALRKTL